jgi:hypothetical protein
MGGLLVATVLTLLVVPALYALWFRVRRDEGVETAEIPAEPASVEQLSLPIAAE